MESTILFIGEKHFAGTAAGSVIFYLRKKTSYRQNLRNATNLLSTFESSPTCLFKSYLAADSAARRLELNTEAGTTQSPVQKQ